MFRQFPDAFKDKKPDKFDYPFYYTPKELALKASQQLMQDLENNILRHDFTRIGKMFGVLICEKDQKIGFLQGFSGILENEEKPDGFVPHLYDKLPNLQEIKRKKEEINLLTVKIKELEEIDHSQQIELIKDKIDKRQNEIDRFKTKIKEKKKYRKQIREQSSHLSNFNEINNELIKQSLADKHEFKVFSQKVQNEIVNLQKEIQDIHSPLQKLIDERKQKSIKLHATIYQSYELLNINEERKNLIELFEDSFPPAGTGDCALPKLLQYAFENYLKPLGFAEFWWGAPHKAQIRKHKNFYHACTSKCKPILKHMLKEIPMDKNPITSYSTQEFNLEEIFQDESIIIINKPPGLLSVPGTIIKDSVLERVKNKYSQLTGPIIVHRLDQDTSGLMVLAKNEKAYRHLQKQFMNRSIKKQYTALLDGKLDCNKGTINLPLSLDLENRPLQIVDYKNGKESITDYEVIKHLQDKTLVHFYPRTGRTHQLRMHAAHQDGLNTPIVGDDFYGTKGNRLHLHASKLTFIHPDSKELLTFSHQATFF